MHGDEREKLRLACRVAERFQHMGRLDVGRHWTSLPAKRESCGVPPRVLAERPPYIRNPAAAFPPTCPRW